MLNYIWISLIAIGILAAIGNDMNDEVKNTYRNGIPLEVRLEVKRTPDGLQSRWEGDLILAPETFNQFYGIQQASAEIRQPVVISTSPSGESVFLMSIGESAPVRWKTMAKYAMAKDKLSGSVRALHIAADRRSGSLQLVIEPIRFVKMKAITDAAIEYAKTAVEIAMGLIGIMALWLGVMKVADEAGLVKILTRMLTPLSRRLFPDVPPDHPAIGAIIMNISANMLGLNNAATPFGLKAMEELNKLNPKVGTATNAMCTFLVINTSGLVLIPATAIAVRAAAGSSNPGIIIGTSIVGAGCATVVGIFVAKIMEKLPRYKKDLVVESSDQGKEARHG
jgi:spore maturation protein A